MKVRIQLTSANITVLDRGFLLELEYDGKDSEKRAYTDLDKLTDDIKEEVLTEWE